MRRVITTGDAPALDQCACSSCVAVACTVGTATLCLAVLANVTIVLAVVAACQFMDVFAGCDLTASNENLFSDEVVVCKDTVAGDSKQCY